MMYIAMLMAVWIIRPDGAAYSKPHFPKYVFVRNLTSSCGITYSREVQMMRTNTIYNLPVARA